MWSKAYFVAKFRFANYFVVDMPVETVKWFKGAARVLLTCWGILKSEQCRGNMLAAKIHNENACKVNCCTLASSSLIPVKTDA